MDKIITILLSLVFLFASENNFILKPKFNLQYFSHGSIYNYSKNDYSSLNNFSLNLSKITKNFSFSSSFYFSFGKNILDSTTFINPNINFENSRGFYNNDNRWFQSSDFELNYKLNNLSLFFGKIKNKWNFGKTGLFLSQNTPSYPQFGFLWNISNKLSFEYFYGSLISQINDTTLSNKYHGVGKRDVFIDRLIAAHRLIWNPLPYLTFNAMELVIFGNRNIEYTYLMPLIPFWSTQSYNGDIDNIQICGEIILNINENNIYTSLFVDEWRPEWTFDKINRNWFGYQIGIVSNNLFTKNDNFRIEYTWTDHRIYRHRFQINDSYSNGYALGFWAGPHAEELYIKYEFTIKTFIIKSFISNMKRGELTYEMLENQYIETKNNEKYKRYNNLSESRNIISIKAEKYFLKNKYMVYFENELIRWENPGFNPYSPKTKMETINKISLNIGLTFATDIIFNNL